MDGSFSPRGLHLRDMVDDCLVTNNMITVLFLVIV